MTFRPRTLRALSVLLALPSFAAGALEVGPLQVFSEGGQNLQAEIWVRGTPLELSDLSARPAAAELYAGAQLPFSSVANRLQVVVERREQDRAVVLLRTPDAVPAGKSTLLLDLRWPGGGLIRGYTIAMESVIAPQAAPRTEHAAAPASNTHASATPPTPPVASNPTPETATQVASAPPAAGEYLTHPGDTLDAIARRESLTGTSAAQRMAAIFELNPQHFADGNPDRLRSGVNLRMPSAEEASRRPEAEARALLLQARGVEARREAIAREAAQAAPTAEAPPSRKAEGRLAAALAEPSAAPDNKGRLYIAQGGETRSRGGRLAQLEEALANQTQRTQEGDARLRQLEDTVNQLNTLLALQREQLEARRAQAASQPVATSDAGATPQGLLSALPPGAGPQVEDRRDVDRPWHRRPEVQMTVMVLALLSFSALLYTLVTERIETAKRRKRRAERERRHKEKRSTA